MAHKQFMKKKPVPQNSLKDNEPLKKMTPKKSSKKPQLLRGMKDILPQEQPYWEYVQESAQQASRAYGYQRIEVPVLEEYQLFARTVGESSDIVSKEMYDFETPGGDHVALRPEFTAGICRAFIEHGMKNIPQPVKLWTDGPLFRYDRPQAGRYRQLHQVDWEIIGSHQPAIDAELISLGSHLLGDLGLEVMARVNSIGCRECRPAYIAVLKEYFKTHKKNLCEDCKNRLLKNPLRVLDCKEEACQAIAAEAPQIVDHLCEACREHFMKVLEYLDEGDVVYHLHPRLVRGLDYYSHTVFEFYLQKDQEEASPAALLGGGRYDYLIQDLGGPGETPAVGMAMGIERVILAIKEAGVPVAQPPTPDVFLAQIGETARKRALQLFEDLRQAEIAVAANISKNGLSDQLSLANKSQAKITLILGQKEMIDNTIIARDMENGSQETILQTKLIDFLKKQLKK
ncbi:MAG: histidine--tRNA ligase [Candidatus Kerfeldbacteria bacterium]|nr:histidine--tRNA ligase [Candidatus Kerfeldbacteria bacterium]